MIARARLRFGMVGAGGIAQVYAQAFREVEIADLVAVSDIRPESAVAIAQSLGCRSYASHESMVQEENLDAVIICTPPCTHPDLANELASEKLHVLCEKPLAIDSASARRMFAVADEHGVKLTLAMNFRYATDVVRAKALVSSGILGDIILFENVFTERRDMSRRWNSNAAVSGGGVLVDNGTHSVDLMRYFLGPVSELQAIEGRRVLGLDVEDTVRLVLRTDSGVMGSVDLSWSMNKEQPYYLSIYGTQGTVLVGWQASKYRRSTDTEWVKFGEGYNRCQAFRSQIENFSRAIRGEDKLLVRREDALASVEVIETAYESLQGSRWLAVNQDQQEAEIVRGQELVHAAGQVS